jgi:hypothetical protein
MFLKGLVYGLVTTVLNFGILYLAVRRLMSNQPSRVKLWLPLVYILRYVLFGGLIFLFFRFQLGDFWGLLVGVTAGIAGYMIWQAIDARRRRSSNL